MSFTTRSIILAEDNEDDAFLTTRAIEAAGITHTVHNCRDGQAVIEYLESLLSNRDPSGDGLIPDLVLLDLKMHRMGGLEALKWIREHQVFKSSAVVALTSSREDRDVKAAYDLHINAYLVKPSSLAEMIELARSIRHFWLDQSHLILPRISIPFEQQN